ncbi:hypothetical protein B0H19DRAFT_1308121 [Mycena capillaripes]|nr:hypothetical protein B0H19DRAFT_1308121 [Mycena capillaripes]
MDLAIRWLESWIEILQSKSYSHGCSPTIAQCKVKGAFKFSRGCGAVLVMENDMISVIDPPGALKRLLKDPSMRGFVVVSEVHCCSSYARLLTADGGSTIALGLKVEPPLQVLSAVPASISHRKGDIDWSPGRFRRP